MTSRLPLIFVVVALTGAVQAQRVEEFAVQAAQLTERRELQEAVSLLERGLTVHPEAPELLLQLGGLLVHLGRAEEGDALLARALKLQPHNTEILRNRAEANLRRGKLAEAVRLFTKALWHQSEDAESHHRIGFVLFLQGDQKKALEHAERAVEINPFHAPYRRFLSMLLAVERRFEESYQQLLMAFRLDPEDADTLYKLSLKAGARGQFGQALEFADLAVERDGENPLYHRQLADVYRRLGATEKADGSARKAESLQAAFDDYLRSLRLKRKGRLEDAALLLEQAVRREPAFPTGLMMLADLYRQMGRNEEALNTYLRVLELDPDRAAAREEGAWLQVRSGSVGSAIELLSHARDPSVNRELLEGYRLMAEKKWGRALEKFQGVLADNPLTPELLQLTAYCLSETGQREEALELLSKAETIEPNDDRISQQGFRIKLEEAFALQSQKSWGAALGLFEELLRTDGPQAVYYLNAAYCRQQLGDLAGAVQDYRKGLRLSAGEQWARINLAASLDQLSRFEESLPEWRWIASRWPTSSNLLQLGLCYARLERYPEAEAVFEQALRFGDDSPELLYNLGVTRIRLMKLQDGWAQVRYAARQGHPAAQALLRRSRPLAKPQSQ